MEKRFLLAMVLSVLVLMAYSSFMPKPKPLMEKEVVRESLDGQGAGLAPKESEKSTAAPVLSATIDNQLEDNDLIAIETPAMLLKFSARGGYLANVVYKAHKNTLAFRNIGLVAQWADEPFEVSQGENRIEFKRELSDGSLIQKSFIILSNNELSLNISYTGASLPGQNAYDLYVAQFDKALEKNAIAQRYYEYVVSRGGVIGRKSALGDRKEEAGSGKFEWVALTDRYFAVVVLPQDIINEVDMKKNGSVSGLSMRVASRNQGGGDTFRFYVGAQKPDELRMFHNGAEKVVKYGPFDPIAKVILFFLNIYHKFTGSWGWAIILVTLTIYVLLFPLSMKSMLSMRKMQALQPKVEELRVKYKDNPQKLNTETMELYKREKVNPLGGCLPMLLQIPVFVALYQLLMRYTSLKGASFGWIKDLSEPDRFIVLKSDIPLIGNELNILPLLMAGVMFFQQKLTSSSSSASGNAMAEQQKMMAIMMPILFGFLFYRMPSGLVLYWLFNSLLMLVFQWKISKKTIA